MKLNLYISKLIRGIICKVGRQEASKLTGFDRTTLYRIENNKYDRKSEMKNLPHICEKYCEVYPKEDLKEVMMQGLHYYLEDALKDKV